MNAQTTPSVRLNDSTLRDGSHAIRHQFTPDDVRRIAARLDRAGVYAVSVGHGDGLGASSIHYGLAAHTDEELQSAAMEVLQRAILCAVLVPGTGTKDHLRAAFDRGARLLRVATHCTEADIGIQHIGLGRELGMEVHSDLMMAHQIPPAELARQARIMADAGANGVYIMDTAGALTIEDAVARVDAFREALPADVEVGIHAHNNLSLAVAISVEAVRAGATLVDACLAGMGAGAGNCQTEALVATLERMGFPTGTDLWALQDAADDAVRPVMTQPPVIDRSTLTLGFAGVPSSFLLHARKASEQFGVDEREILVELGRRKAVGGQEDMIIQIAAELASERMGVSQPT
jgi:4-hydroxy 2-oxovalerate aldolase